MSLGVRFRAILAPRKFTGNKGQEQGNLNQKMQIKDFRNATEGMEFI